jgi:hypothetical protein
MGWNHRVVRRTYPNGETYLEIHECFYEKGEPVDGKPWGIGERPRLGKLSDLTDRIVPGGEDIEDLRWLLTKMLECLDKPVIDYETRERV